MDPSSCVFGLRSPTPGSTNPANLPSLPHTWGFIIVTTLDDAAKDVPMGDSSIPPSLVPPPIPYPQNSAKKFTVKKGAPHEAPAVDSPATWLAGKMGAVEVNSPVSTDAQGGLSPLRLTGAAKGAKRFAPDKAEETNEWGSPVSSRNPSDDSSPQAPEGKRVRRF